MSTFSAATIRDADSQHWVGKALSLSNERWLKRALGAAQKRDRSNRNVQCTKVMHSPYNLDPNCAPGPVTLRATNSPRTIAPMKKKVPCSKYSPKVGALPLTHRWVNSSKTHVEKNVDCVFVLLVNFRKIKNKITEKTKVNKNLVKKVLGKLSVKTEAKMSIKKAVIMDTTRSNIFLMSSIKIKKSQQKMQM